jgi:hypothetical protein
MRNKHNVTTRKKEEKKVLHWVRGLGAPNFDPNAPQPTKNYINGFNSLVDYFQTKDYISTNPEIFGYRLKVQPYSKFQMPMHVERIKEMRKRPVVRSLEMDVAPIMKKEEIPSSILLQPFEGEEPMDKGFKKDDFEKKHKVLMDIYREKNKSEPYSSSASGSKHVFSLNRLQNFGTENSFHKSANTTINATEPLVEFRHLSTPPFKNPFDKRNYQFNKIISSLSANEKSWKKITENLAKSESPYYIGGNSKTLVAKTPKRHIPTGNLMIKNLN